MTTTALLVLQTLTNLAFAPARPGLPDGWRLTRIAHTDAPHFAVTAAHVLRIETSAQAGFASYRLRVPLRPGAGRRALTWRWRTSTPLRRASLRSRARDDSPVRVLVAFDDGTTLYYTWGNAEPVGDIFRSSVSTSRGVVVLRRAEDANGSWYLESRDPFADYRRAFSRAPHPIVAVGIGANTEHLNDHTMAEVGELTWE